MHTLDLPITMLDRPRRTFVETRSRRTDCDTSKAAAKAAVTRKADGERQAITAAVERSYLGLTARQIAMVTGIDYITVQRRVSECGLTKTKRSRGGCRVWIGATDA
jgi:hypothetical protein